RTIAADLLVPAAGSYVIDAGIAAGLDVSVIAEAANVATSADAEAALAARGVAVVPDFIANMATNAWWWWILTGDIALTCKAAFARTDELMHALVGEAITRTDPGRPLRDAAMAMARERMDRAIADAAASGAPSGVG
ncbi:MAG: glutamate dehydrogenase, partial [Solirubrobacteraceae bacterium]